MTAHPTIQRYVALGDSLSEGFFDWGRGDRSLGFASILAGLLRERNADLAFTNLGRAGARVADVSRAQVEQALALEPDLVTLIVGANDLAATPADQFRRLYADIVKRLRTNSTTIVAVANIPDFVHLLPPQYAGYGTLVQNRTREFNQIIAAVAAAHGARLVDLATNPEAEDPRNVSSDRVHPNARGYRAMARAFVETLNRAGLNLTPPPLDL